MQEALLFSHRSKIFTSQQIREIDKLTLERQAISSLDLVKRVATELCLEMSKHINLRNTRFTFFCGTGNNGSDGLALAWLLCKSNPVEVFCVKTSKEPTADFSSLVSELPFEIVWLEPNSPFEIGGEVVVDAMLGSGLNRPVEGLVEEVIKAINQSGKTIISLDIASGLSGEANTIGLAVKADITLTLDSLKFAFFLAENQPYSGQIEVVDIGLDITAKDQTQTHVYLAEPQDLSKWLKKRPKFSHKGTFGKALLIAGSRTMSGAAVLAALGCLRSGVGLLNVHSTQTHALPPEVLTSQDPNPDFWTLVPRDFHNYTAIGIGSGIGTHNQTLKALESTIELIENRPLVLDADALNLLHSTLIKKLKPRTILTPHPKEFDRLTQGHKNSRDRIETAREFAITNNLIVCLKGAHTATCLPDGRLVFNSSGNPGMATAGSGDVLTGVVLGLLAQGYEPEQAAILGVYLHGLAGDLAAQAHSPEALIASDIAANLGSAFTKIRAAAQSSIN